MNQSETEIEILAEKIARWARARSAEIERAIVGRQTSW